MELKKWINGLYIMDEQYVNGDRASLCFKVMKNINIGGEALWD